MAQAGILLAVVAFAALCVLVLRASPRLVEPDDYAYRASITAITDGHLLTLSAAQVHALSAQLAGAPGGPGSPGPGGPIIQWVQLPGGRWISEKDPGYPFLAAPFQLLGIIRLAPLCYAALGCLGLFAGARRWLGQFGAGVAVGLFCSSGAALLFAWRDYMPTFTDASLIAAGTGALLWAVLADETAPARRTWAGLAGSWPWRPPCSPGTPTSWYSAAPWWRWPWPGGCGKFRGPRWPGGWARWPCPAR